MRKFAIIAAAAAVALSSSPALAQGKSSGRKAQEKGVAEIPVCQKKLGTIAIVEPDNNWWQGLGLGSPEAVLKMFVMKSGCFSLVDRNKGLQSRNLERALADSGELQRGSNIGRAQVKAADYFIVPDIVSKNDRSGGGGLGGVLGGLGSRMGGFGGFAGSIAGNISVNKKEANVLLTLVNARTTEQERMTEGYARKSDWSFGGGAGGFWGGGYGSIGGGGYQNTDIGQVLVLAYLNAYKDLVTQLGGLPTNPSAAAPQAQ